MSIQIQPSAPALELPKERDIYLIDEIDSESCADVIRKINAVCKHDTLLAGLYPLHGIDYTPKPIRLLIDSGGGDAYPALGLVGVMQASTTPVDTMVLGCAMSAAALVSMCGRTRYAHRTSTIMIHQISASDMSGTLKEIQEGEAEMVRLQDLLDSIVFGNTKLTPDKFAKLFKEKNDCYLTVEEAVKLGIIDKIIQ